MNSSGRARVMWFLVLSTVTWSCARDAASDDESSRRIAELGGEIAALREQVETLQERVELFSQDPHMNVDDALPLIEAYVLEVKRDLKLVVLNKGRKDGVKEGYTFSVYRGTHFKGQVRVQDVQEGMCAGLITGEKAPIERGDSATTSL